MIDVKNMSDNDIEFLIKLLKQEANKRIKKGNAGIPTGVIKIVLNSYITNSDGKQFDNEPKVIEYKTIDGQIIDSILNQDEKYIYFVNQALSVFKDNIIKDGLNQGALLLSYKEIASLHMLIHRIQAYCPQISEADINLLKKVSDILS